MKLIVQIPCLNEELMIAWTIRNIPREVTGVDEVEVLVIDDGSTDRTVDEARAAGGDHILQFTGHQGYSAAFSAGLHRSLSLGADVVVQMDGDGQHPAEHIPELIAPILRGEADLVVGVRPIEEIAEYSWLKRKLQLWGSSMVRRVSGTDIADTTCGFRAYSREAALRLTMFTSYSPSLEMLIQAGRTNLTTAQVPVNVNPQTRPSRIIRSIPQYVFRQLVTTMRIYVLYKPLPSFLWIAGTLLSLAGLLSVRYLVLHFATGHTGHVQSLLLAGVLAMVAFVVAVAGLLADLLGANRKLLQEILYGQRKLRLDMDVGAPPPAEPVTRQPRTQQPEQSCTPSPRAVGHSSDEGPAAGHETPEHRVRPPRVGASVGPAAPAAVKRSGPNDGSLR